MKVISTNIGEKQAIIWRGKEVQTGIYKYPVNRPIFLGTSDVETDNVIDRKYHGGEDKACYLYSADHYPVWKKEFPLLEWQYGMFGENLSIEGFDETKIYIGDVYKLGDALVQITQPRQPCFKLGIRLGNSKAVKQFVKAEKPGAYVRVLEPGMVATGDLLISVESNPNNFSLQKVFHLIYNANKNIAAIKKAIKMTGLAENCRNDLIKYAKISVNK